MNGQELKQLLRAANVSQRDLAKRVRCDHSVISRICSENRQVPNELADRMNAVLKPKLRENLQLISEAL